MNVSLSHRFRDALALAVEAHAGQVRKGSETPYVGHPLQVCGIALEHGADEEQAIAALLHDVLEDTDATYEDVQARFGTRVADIVRGCSDSEEPDAKGPWRERKERYLAHLAEVGPDIALVSCSDKLHNARSILTDLRTHGNALWDRFTGKQDGSLWYYDQLVAVFARLPVPAALRAELGDTVRRIHASLGKSPPAPTSSP
ncbi:MAG: HD domain-containing protein [Planctomycetota bacterium]